MAVPEAMVFAVVNVLEIDEHQVSGFVMQARRNIPSTPQPAETLRLVKAFLTITCAMERQRLIEYAERVAEEHGQLEVIAFTTGDEEPEVSD